MQALWRLLGDLPVKQYLRAVAALAIAGLWVIAIRWEDARLRLHRSIQEREEAARVRWARAVKEYDLPGPQPWVPWHKAFIRWCRDWKDVLVEFWRI